MRPKSMHVFCHYLSSTAVVLWQKINLANNHLTFEANMDVILCENNLRLKWHITQHYALAFFNDGTVVIGPLCMMMIHPSVFLGWLQPCWLRSAWRPYWSFCPMCGPSILAYPVYLITAVYLWGSLTSSSSVPLVQASDSRAARPIRATPLSPTCGLTSAPSPCLCLLYTSPSPRD